MDSSNYEKIVQYVLPMIVISSVTPIVTELIKGIIELFKYFGPITWQWIKNIFLPKKYSITIRLTSSINKNGSWINDNDEWTNYYLISAIEEFIEQEKLFSEGMRCILGEGNSNITTKVEYAESRKFRYMPEVSIKYKKIEILCETWNERTNNPNNPEKRTKQIIIVSKESTQDANNFIQMCYKRYITTHYSSTNDGKQFYYRHIPSKNDIRFNKYEINNKTTFNDIFFPEKQTIIELVKKLKSGQLPKLSFLLYGEPGCGKTSIVKAIAKLTGYHVIVINLNNVRNDEDLFHIFNSNIVNYQNFMNKSENLEYDVVKPNSRIYLFEDIDACGSDIVKQRNMELPKIIEEPDFDKGDTKKSKFEQYYDIWKEKGPTLSGLLNVLDGVLEINGSIIIMTTNCPDKLDPALIRHGRITMKLEMRKLARKDAGFIVNKYFGTSDINIPDGKITPATLEAYCQSAKNISELKKMIAAK